MAAALLLDVQVKEFIDLQLDYNKLLVDTLQCDWLYDAIRQLQALVPLSVHNDGSDTLAARFANDELTALDATLLPFFKRVLSRFEDKADIEAVTVASVKRSREA